MKSKLCSLRIKLLWQRRILTGLFVSLAILVSFSLSAGAAVQADNPQQNALPHTTLIIFADHRMEDRQWADLFDALKKNQAEAVMETPALAGTYEIVRGDTMEPGLLVDNAIVVHLHGDCRLTPFMGRTEYGKTLGWVLWDRRQIAPFAHVDCDQIGQVLGPQTSLGLNREQRNMVMAGGIARVILHEWMHIATQSPSHAKHGILKSRFGAADLLASTDQSIAKPR